MSMQNKKKGAGKPIGGIGQYAVLGGKKGSDVQQSEHLESSASSSPDVQAAESLEVQHINSPDVQTVKPANVKKSKHPDWKQQTIYLPPVRVRQLKMRAVMDEKELSEIVNEALEEYFHYHPDGQT